MQTMNGLLQFLETSYTPYHAVENAQKLLNENGFTRLHESEKWELKQDGKYYVVRGGSALIAFTVGERHGYRIVASHTDSPCLKLKNNPVMLADGYTRLNTEPYGGGIWYSFFDRPLRVAGRVIDKKKNGTLEPRLYTGEYTLVVPSVAVHMNRDVNSNFAPNPQTDLLPLYAVGEGALGLSENTVAYDLYLACAQPPFFCGANGELIGTPRADNLTSVYSSLQALVSAKPNAVNVCACFDSEEVGSRTLQGAGSDFLRTTLERISACRKENKEDLARALSASFLLSLDNAHAVHPNRPEKCDPTNRPVLGGGVVIKSHADRAYTTDALTCAVVQTIFDKAGVKYQHFFNRSDMRSGSTLGAISLSQVGVPSCDIGLAQLAMHSAVETFSKDDYAALERGLTAYYQSEIACKADTIVVK